MAIVYMKPDESLTLEEVRIIFEIWAKTGGAQSSAVAKYPESVRRKFETGEQAVMQNIDES